MATSTVRLLHKIKPPRSIGHIAAEPGYKSFVIQYMAYTLTFYGMLEPEHTIQEGEPTMTTVKLGVTQSHRASQE